MIVNQATLQSIYRSFKTIFNKALETAQPVYERIATVVPSTTREEEYKWLGRVPRMREWIGDRVIQNLAAHGYTIKNRDWEATVSVDRNDIEDDAIGIYTPLIQALGQSAAIHPDELVFELLVNGFIQKCYDGQPFFAPEHKDGNQPPQSNVTDAALSAASYAAARAAMMSFKDEHGRPLKIVPNLLVVPPALEGIGREILLSDRDAAGKTNPWKGTAELMVAPELAGHDTMWFLLDTSKPVKPLIFQQRKRPEFVAKDSPDDDNVFMKKEFLYGVDSRDNAGYGLWQLAYGSTGTAA
jgi:phage major head subunit gpT-like protein